MKPLHKQFVEYGRNAKQWFNKCKMLLLEIDESRVWREKGFFSIHDYAARLAGMSESMVSKSLWILRKIKDKPNLLKMAEERGLSSLEPIISIATNETEDFWAEKVKTMSNDTLRTYIREIKIQSTPTLQINQNAAISFGAEESENISVIDATPESPPEPRDLLFLNLDPATLTRLRKAKGNKSWDQIITELLDAQKSQLETEKPEPVTTGSQHIPAKIEKFILKRCNGFCEITNCTKPYSQLHHADRFSITKTHDPDRIVALCHAHHQIAHHTLYKNEQKSPETWEVSLNPDLTDLRHRIDILVQNHRASAIRAP